jgi:hypothetical protein
MGTQESRPRLKWARSQRFRLTIKGEEAHGEWKNRVGSVQGQGKSVFETALGEWSKHFGIAPDDAPYVSELAQTSLRVEDIEKAFADMGTSRQGIKDSLSRLYDAGLVEPVPS